MSVWVRWSESRARKLGHGVRVLGRLGAAVRLRSSLPPPVGPDPGGRPSPNRVVVLGTGFVGDLVLATPLLSVLRRAFPEAELTLMVRDGVRELLAEAPLADRLVGVANDGRDDLLAHGAALRSGSPDLTLVLPHTVEAALFAWATGAPVRVGHASQGRGFLLTRRAPNAKTVHEVERLLGLARALEVDVGDAPAPRAWPPASARVSAGRLLEGFGGRGGPLVGVAVGARNPARRWPSERWAALLGALLEARGANVVLLGGPEDGALAQEVVARLGAESAGQEALVGRILDLAGRSSLGEVAWLLDPLDLFLGSDSGLLHLAAARGVPVVGLYGPGDPVAWGPRGEGHRVVRVPMACSPCANHACSSVACIREIGVDRVLREALGVLDRPRSS